MAQNKTQPTAASVMAFLNTIENRDRRDDCVALMKIMQTVSRKEPVMWGSAIVGFGTVHYKYDSGREGDIVAIGFSPRKEAISLYMMCSLGQVKEELQKLGKHKTGKGCLYIKSLADVDKVVLKDLLAKAFKEATRRSVPTV
jgi:hypothetical protein